MQRRTFGSLCAVVGSVPRAATLGARRARCPTSSCNASPAQKGGNGILVDPLLAQHSPHRLFNPDQKPPVAEIVPGHRLPGSWQVYDQHDYLPEQAKACNAWIQWLEKLMENVHMQSDH